jgi:hypothetical protein
MVWPSLLAAFSRETRKHLQSLAEATDGGLVNTVHCLLQSGEAAREWLDNEETHCSTISFLSLIPASLVLSLSYSTPTGAHLSAHLRPAASLYRVHRNNDKRNARVLFIPSGHWNSGFTSPPFVFTWALKHLFTPPQQSTVRFS